MDVKPIFGVVVAIIIVLLVVFLFPTVNTSIQGTIASDSSHWNSEVDAGVRLMPMAFIVLGGLCALWFALHRGK